MATIKAQNNQRNATNDGWNVIHHETEASIVLYSDGTNVESNYVRQPGYGTTTGTANAYALTLSPAPTALVDGLAICAKINILNTGASAINVNGLGAKSILDSKGNAMTAGKLKANTPYTMRYNGTNFILQGEGASGNAIASDLLSGKTASVDAGDITGAMANRGAISITPSAAQQSIPVGYHNGSGYVAGDADLVAGNIKKNVNIFGIAGALPAPDMRVADLYANTRVPSKDGYSYDIGNNGYYCVAKYTMSGTFIGFFGPSTGSANVMSGIDDYRDQIIALYTGGSYIIYRLTKGGTLVSSYYENYINMSYPGAVVYAENYVFGFRFYSGQSYMPCSTTIDGTYVGHCINILLTLSDIASTHLADLGDGNLLILGPVDGIMLGGSPSSGKVINMHQGSLGKFISVKS